MALLVALTGVAFNCCNGYLNGWHLTISAISDRMAPRSAVSRRCGALRRRLRHQFSIRFDSVEPAQTGRNRIQAADRRILSLAFVPNYFGELLEWTGWAIATWSLPGLAFAVWTAANLVPRARANHRWYQEKFPEYPRQRRAVLPGLY